MKNKRLEALARELGEIVDIDKVRIEYRAVTTNDFLLHLSRMIAKFRNVDTSKPDELNTKLFLVSLYMKPPPLVFIEIKTEKGIGRGKLIDYHGRVYELVFDRLANVFGAKKKFIGTENSKVILGHYIPISADYLVSRKFIDPIPPLYRVTDGRRGALWYVYNCSFNPIPFNVYNILSL